jgi:anti-sigma regulatory factor (Ser/Thr protein kinase)
MSIAFEHEALLYAGIDEFVSTTARFVAEGVAAGEPVLVVVAAPKIERLRERLGAAAGGVEFADMAAVGANPARIIPAWQEFVAAHRGAARLRGVGEPIDESRAPAALAECQGHEALLNVAFDDGPPWTLLCPYDTTALPPPVIAVARATHPRVRTAAGRALSDSYDALAQAALAFDTALAAAPDDAVEVAVELNPASLARLRTLVTRRGAQAGLTIRRIEDAVAAISEAVVDAAVHGQQAMVRLWERPGLLVAELSEQRRIAEPLSGRVCPEHEDAPRGLWIANQLCDLVQLRNHDGGSTVRLHIGS